jgi:hypothetical protein
LQGDELSANDGTNAEVDDSDQQQWQERLVNIMSGIYKNTGTLLRYFLLLSC